MSDTDLVAAIANALRSGAGSGGENADARRSTDEAVTNSQTNRT
ncbi:MAG TPA: hypothetical protein VFT59_01245 [Candidatus Saccharimonadales bacterium]|nr:hypothetical protein [Candidatus Saccharimonadales bacterium]